MSASISLTETQVFAALRTFLLTILPGGMTTPASLEVVRGQANRVPEPTSSNFVVMWPVLRTRLEMTSNTYTDVVNPVGNPSGTNAATAPTEFVIQCDFHGPSAGDNAQIFTTLFRDQYACDVFDATGLAIAPLYTSDPRQVPFVNGENQYEERYSVDASLQVNVTISTPQDFASTLGPVGLIEVDTTYP